MIKCLYCLFSFDFLSFWCSSSRSYLLFTFYSFFSLCFSLTTFSFSLSFLSFYLFLLLFSSFSLFSILPLFSLLDMAPEIVQRVEYEGTRSTQNIVTSQILHFIIQINIIKIRIILITNGNLRCLIDV
jgi:hypothetical protein